MQYLKKESSYEVNVLHADEHEKSLLQVDTFIFDGVGQACPKYLDKFAMSLWHLKNEVRNGVRDLTVLATSNTITVYYASNVLPPMNLFLPQYEVHVKPLLHLIVCVP